MIDPVVVIRPIRFELCSVNHSAAVPAGPTLIPTGMLLNVGSLYSVIAPEVGEIVPIAP